MSKTSCSLTTSSGSRGPQEATGEGDGGLSEDGPFLALIKVVERWGQVLALQAFTFNNQGEVKGGGKLLTQFTFEQLADILPGQHICPSWRFSECYECHPQQDQPVLKGLKA